MSFHKNIPSNKLVIQLQERMCLVICHMHVWRSSSIEMTAITLVSGNMYRRIPVGYGSLYQPRDAGEVEKLFRGLLTHTSGVKFWHICVHLCAMMWLAPYHKNIRTSPCRNSMRINGTRGYDVHFDSPWPRFLHIMRVTMNLLLCCNFDRRNTLFR